MQQKEAIIIGKYLLGKEPEKNLLERYVEACRSLQMDSLPETDKLTKIILQYPFFLPYFDAALALHKEKNLLRKKILLMIAILETSPDHYEYFTSKNYSFVGWVKIFLKGLNAIFKAAIGKILLLFLS